MSYQSFISSLGFRTDPFAKTNADDEEQIESYFIEPPFFSAVYGDPQNPSSSVVFAPRGNGKTALKRKIELSSLKQNYLCITYNSFDVSSLSISEVNLDYHLSSIIRIAIIAILSSINEQNVSNLRSTDRHILYLFVKQYLSRVDKSTFKTCISSVKNIPDKAKEIWNTLLGPLSIAINAILVRFGFETAELSKFESQEGSIGNKLDQLSELYRLSVLLGYHSIYVLVDKVDETAITSTATDAFTFIRPLLGNLHLLELNGYAFKFFLWDQLLENYRSISRPDRVKYYTINWEGSQLVQMLSKRVSAFSDGRINTMKELFDGDFELDQFCAIFAQGSPRTLIRICKEILDQQSEIDSTNNKISTDAVINGFNNISENISKERYSEAIIRELRKNKRLDFTVKQVSSIAFKISQQAGINKIASWVDSGAVKQIGKIHETKGARTSNHYVVNDLLLAKYVFDELSIIAFTINKLWRCKNCKKIILRDWDILKGHNCEHCQCEIIHKND